jgi:protein phosphatase
VVGGAAARDRGRATSASSDSAAGRAALARSTGEVEPDEEDDDPEPPPHRVRTAILALLALALVAGTAFLGWQYTQSQYYVGKTDDDYVAVFRGIRGSIGGVHLSDIAQRSELKVTELQPVVRGQVQQGIPAESRTDANNIVRRLQDQRRDCAPSSSPSPQPTAAASATARATASPKITPRVAVSPTPVPRLSPTVGLPTSVPSPSSTSDCAPR